MKAGAGEGIDIWFAGKHTAPFVDSGTVTGAYRSGENIAKDILRTYKLDH